MGTMVVYIRVRFSWMR